MLSTPLLNLGCLRILKGKPNKGTERHREVVMRDAEGERALAERRVLIVEDEYFLADDMAQALAGLGAEVVGPVPTEDKALALITGNEPLDLAVLDINLKGKTVFPVAEALRARGVPFVFATGYAAVSVPAEFRNVPRWEKPFDPEDLAEALSGMITTPTA